MSSDEYSELHPLVRDDLGPVTDDEAVLKVRVQITDPSTMRFVDVEKDVAMHAIKEWLEFFALGMSYVFQAKLVAWQGTIVHNNRKIMAIKLLRMLSGMCATNGQPDVESTKSLGLKEAKENVEQLPFNVFVVGERAKRAVDAMALQHNLQMDFKHGPPPKTLPNVASGQLVVPVIYEIGMRSTINSGLF